MKKHLIFILFILFFHNCIFAQENTKIGNVQLHTNTFLTEKKTTEENNNFEESTFNPNRFKTKKEITGYTINMSFALSSINNGDKIIIKLGTVQDIDKVKSEVYKIQKNSSEEIHFLLINESTNLPICKIYDGLITINWFIKADQIVSSKQITFILYDSLGIELEKKIVEYKP
jgi:hypothetical protein